MGRFGHVVQAELISEESKPGGGDAVLDLPPILDALAADELLAVLRERAGSGAALDAAAVERVSTNAVQVLIAAASEGAPDGGRFRLRHPSPALAAGFADLGLADFLDSWVGRS